MQATTPVVLPLCFEAPGAFVHDVMSCEGSYILVTPCLLFYENALPSPSYQFKFTFSALQFTPSILLRSSLDPPSHKNHHHAAH